MFFSSITSHIDDETNYDVGYSHVREDTSAEPHYVDNTQAESRTLDHLYSRVGFIIHLWVLSTYRNAFLPWLIYLMSAHNMIAEFRVLQQTAMLTL